MHQTPVSSDDCCEEKRKQKQKHLQFNHLISELISNIDVFEWTCIVFTCARDMRGMQSIAAKRRIAHRE